MKFKESIQSLAILGGGQSVVILLNVVFYFVFAYLLGPEKYGNFVYFISIATIIPAFTRFGLSQSVITFSAKKDFELKKSVNLLAFISAIITSAFLMLFDPFVAFLSFSVSTFMMQIGNYLGKRKYKFVSISQVGRSIIWIVASIFLYFVMDLNGILLGMIIGNLIFSINYFKELNFNSWNFNNLKKKSSSIVRNFGVDISQTIPNQIDKLVIMPLFGFQTTGIFHFAIQVLIAIESFPIILHRFLLAEQSGEKISKRFFSLASLLAAIIILAGIFLSPYIIENIFSEYLESIIAVQLIVFGIIPLLVISILNAKLQVLGSNLVGYGVIIRIGTNLALIPLLGAILGVLGLVLSNLISLVLLMVYLLIIYYKIRNS